MSSLVPAAANINSSHYASGRVAEPQVRQQGRRTVQRTANKPPRVDFARFSHSTHVTDRKLECASCHKFPTKNWKEARKGEEAFPDVAEFPEHSSCLNCHREQFFARERPVPAICSNCHLNATPRDTTRFLFPSLGDVSDPKRRVPELIPEFAIAFPHEKHLDVVAVNKPGRRRDLELTWVRALWSISLQKKPEQPKSCPVCHQLYQPQGNSSEEYVTKAPKNLGDSFWLKKGTFQTLPNSHAGCFICHSADGGIPPAPGDCHSCHKLLPATAEIRADYDPKLSIEMNISDPTVMRLWKRRISAGSFRHEGGEHPELSCLGCHKVALLNGLEPKTRKVQIASCGEADGCHITASVDDGGVLNFELEQKKESAEFVCAKCHIRFGNEPVSPSHLSVIPNPKDK